MVYILFILFSFNNELKFKLTKIYPNQYKDGNHIIKTVGCFQEAHKNKSVVYSKNGFKRVKFENDSVCRIEEIFYLED